MGRGEGEECYIATTHGKKGIPPLRVINSKAKKYHLQIFFILLLLWQKMAKMWLFCKKKTGAKTSKTLHFWYPYTVDTASIFYPSPGATFCSTNYPFRGITPNPLPSPFEKKLAPMCGYKQDSDFIFIAHV